MTLVLFFVAAFIVLIVYKFVVNGKHQDDVKKARFKAVFNVTPRSRKATTSVNHKIAELRLLASVGDEDDIKLLQIAIKTAKQFGFA